MSRLRSSIVDSPSEMRNPTIKVTITTKVTPSAPTMVRSRCDRRSHLSRSAWNRSFNVIVVGPRSRARGGDVEGELLELARLLAGGVVARGRRRHRRDLAGLDVLVEALDLLERAHQLVDLRRGLGGALDIGFLRFDIELEDIDFRFIARRHVLRDLVE